MGKSVPEWTEDKVAESRHFCMMPWVHLHVTQYGTVTPCCTAPWQKEQSFGDLNESSIEEIWNSPEIRAFRKKMLRDQRDARCSRCYEKESGGFSSLRTVTNAEYSAHLKKVNATEKDGYSDHTVPVYWDIRFSNICNYKCRICGPWASSQWHKDAVALGMVPEKSSAITYPVPDKKQLFGQLEAMMPSLEELYFAGGEPLIMEEHYELLDLLIRRGMTHVRLKYNTNFSHLQFKNHNILEYWKLFNKIWVSASLDAMGARGDYLRKGQNWEQTEAQMRTLRQELPHVDFMVAPTIYLFNVHHLPDFHRDWVEKGLIKVEDFLPNLLIQPEIYNIRVLPASLKQEVTDKVKGHIAWMDAQPQEYPEKFRESRMRYEQIISHMNSADHSDLLPELQKRTEQLDKLRGESAKEVFPELAEIL